MKTVEKIITTWFIAFTTFLFISERVWAQVITSPISLYLYLANGIVMIAVWIIYKLVKKNKQNKR